MENIVLHQHTKIELPAAVLERMLAGFVAQAIQGTLASTQEIPDLGDPWPDERGGTYAGVYRAQPGTHYHLIVSPRTMDFVGLQWGAQGTKVDGADSKWDGLANTRVLLNSGLDLPAVTAAAGDQPLNGDAWYLPSQRELALCGANVPDLFETDDWYWSSTQYSAGNAWMQTFSNGDQYIYGKDHSRPRAPRPQIDHSVI